jgi:hypothetical protein
MIQCRLAPAKTIRYTRLDTIVHQLLELAGATTTTAAAS